MGWGNWTPTRVVTTTASMIYDNIGDDNFVDEATPEKLVADLIAEKAARCGGIAAQIEVREDSQVYPTEGDYFMVILFNNGVVSVYRTSPA